MWRLSTNYYRGYEWAHSIEEVKALAETLILIELAWEATGYVRESYGRNARRDLIFAFLVANSLYAIHQAER